MIFIQGLTNNFGLQLASVTLHYTGSITTSIEHDK